MMVVLHQQAISQVRLMSEQATSKSAISMESPSCHHFIKLFQVPVMVSLTNTLTLASETLSESYLAPINSQHSTWILKAREGNFGLHVQRRFDNGNDFRFFG